jgi:hypothetical protein
LGFTQHLFGADAVLQGCRVDDDAHEKPQNVDGDMALEPLDFFSPRRSRRLRRDRRP